LIRFWRDKRHIIQAVKVTQKQALAVPCPTCGAKPGQKCALSTGLPRTYPHRDRRLTAGDKLVFDAERES